MSNANIVNKLIKDNNYTELNRVLFDYLQENNIAIYDVFPSYFKDAYNELIKNYKQIEEYCKDNLTGLNDAACKDILEIMGYKLKRNENRDYQIIEGETL